MEHMATDVSDGIPVVIDTNCTNWEMTLQTSMSDELGFQLNSALLTFQVRTPDLGNT